MALCMPSQPRKIRAPQPRCYGSSSSERDGLNKYEIISTAGRRVGLGRRTLKGAHDDGLFLNKAKGVSGLHK